MEPVVTDDRQGSPESMVDSAALLPDCDWVQAQIYLPQASKSRDGVLGQGIETSLQKPAEGEDGELTSQRPVLPKLEFRLF